MSSPGCLIASYILILRDLALGFAGGERGSRVSQFFLDVYCDRVRAAENTPRDPCHVLERRYSAPVLGCFLVPYSTLASAAPRRAA